jgi:hypothetical protein
VVEAPGVAGFVAGAALSGKTESPACAGLSVAANPEGSALHRTEELVVGLGVLHLVQQELHCGDLLPGPCRNGSTQSVTVNDAPLRVISIVQFDIGETHFAKQSHQIVECVDSQFKG